MRYLTVIASLLCMLLRCRAAKADKRVAFVVGNGAYKNVAQLPNPPIDAKAMAAVLRNVGFDVVEGTNLTPRHHDRASARIRQEGAGRRRRGVLLCRPRHRDQRTNYLLPIDADIKSEMDVKLALRSTSISRSTRP